MNMIPIIILIVGDAQGNHKLAGMKVSFSGTFRVNHSCNCRWLDTDNEKIKCGFMKQSYVRKLCEDENEEELQLLSQHDIKNTFDEVLVGYHLWEQAFCNKSLVYIYQKLLNNYSEMEQEQYIYIYM